MVKRVVLKPIWVTNWKRPGWLGRTLSSKPPAVDLRMKAGWLKDWVDRQERTQVVGSDAQPESFGYKSAHERRVVKGVVLEPFWIDQQEVT